MPAGQISYIADGSGHFAQVSASGALTVQLDSGITLAVTVSGVTVQVSGNRLYAVGQSGVPYYQDTSGRIVTETHITSGHVIVDSLTTSPNVFVVDRTTQQATNVNPLSSMPDYSTTYGVVVQGVVYIKEGNPGDGTNDFTLAYSSISGNGAMKIGTSGRNSVTVTSGLYVSVPPTNFGRSRAVIGCNDLSGGVGLSSGDCEGMLIKNFGTSSGDVYVGFSNEPPYSGFGYALQPSESLTIDISNFNKVAVFGTVSGFCKVTYMGVAFA